MEEHISGDLRALGIFLVPWLAACVLVFLGASDFFTAWSGQAVSVRPPTSEDPAVYRVLVVDGAKSLERTWPAEVVERLSLPVDATGVPPLTLPADRPRTSKLRFHLHFLVENPEGEGWLTVPTTSPRSLGLALVVFVLGLGVRNMMWSGSPVSIRQREAYLPPEQPPAGQPAGGAPSTSGRAGRPKKRPPPPRPKRGPRR